MRFRPLSLVRRRMRDENGAVVVIAALLIVVLFAAVAFVIDIGRLRHTRHTIQNAMDFGALAGAQDLPAQGGAAANTAVASARRVAIANAPELASIGMSADFRCVVGDRNGDGLPDASDIPYVCGPATGTWASGWTLKGTHATHACDPYAGDKCNTIVLQASETVPYYFAPAIGFNQGSTGSVRAASCNGACGAAPSPLDVVMVFDRTASMTPTDIANAKNGASAVLSFYDSSQQWIGLVALPYGQTSNKCAVNDPQQYPQTSMSTWQVTALSSDYTLPSGGLNPASQLVSRLNCLQRAGSPRIYVSGVDRTSAGHTNLGDPMDAARAMLLAQGRANVPDVIIFFTDGEANQPDGLNPCNYLNTRATTAKTAGVDIFTIAYGVAGARCNRDTSGPFAGAYASTNLARAATNSIDNQPGGCPASENTDGDNYFCEAGGASLAPAFRQVAAAALTRSRLIDV